MLTKIGYVRKSIAEPNISKQIEKVKDAGATRIIEETCNSDDEQQLQFQLLLHNIDESDEIIISSFDCLEFDTQKVIDKVTKIQKSGATLQVLDLPNFSKISDEDTRKMVTNVLIETCSYVVKQDRRLAQKRQREGIEMAKKKGKYTGKVREYSPTAKDINKRDVYYKACQLLDEVEKGNSMLNKRQISRILGIAPGTLYSIDGYRKKYKN